MSCNCSEAAEPNRLLTRSEAACRLGISIRKLDGLAASGSVTRVKIGAAVRYAISDLDAYVASLKELYDGVKRGDLPT